jgi:hypothetical protein
MSALDIKSCIGSSGTFGAGDTSEHTISGIVDKDGNAFTPKVIIILPGSGNDWINTGSGQGFTTHLGYDDGVTAVSVAQTSSWAFGGNFNTYGGRNTYSSVAVAALFVLHPIILGKVTALGSGFFKYKLDLSQADWAFKFIALSGSDLEYKIFYQDISLSSTTVIPTTFTVKGAHLGQAGGIGDAVLSDTYPETTYLGFDLTQVSNSCGISGSTVMSCARYQRTNQGLVSTTGAPAGVKGAEITLLDPFTITRFGAQAVIGLLLNINCYVGSFLQPIDDDDVSVFIPRFLPEIVFLASVGAEESITASVGFNYSVGVANRSNQFSTWFGAKNGSTDAANGGQGGSWTDYALRFATPNGSLSSDSIVNGQIDQLSINNNGFRTSWSQCDGLRREVLYLTFGSIIDEAELSGIYQLVPGKRADTLYLTFDPATTDDYKIP